MSLRLLAPDVISRIAAGEVIERPASVIKELVENALDAGATAVSVSLSGGGIDFMQVSDNGCGIPSGEIELAFSRHATSKITTFEDMYALGTLGFRGEALASMAAVADVELFSCSGDDSLGVNLRVCNGVMLNKTSAGRTRGTSVTVRRLFQGVPARLKFLKPAAAEASQIGRIVGQYALAYPEVKFTLVNEGKTTLDTTGSGSLLDAIIQVYGLETARHMLEIASISADTEACARVSGLVSSPELSRSSGERISLFVNRRWTSMRRLSWAVEQAYHGLLTTGRHPVAVINLTIEPAEVDVNIHPTKNEVKFRDESRIFAAIQKCVRRTLVQTAPVAGVAEQPLHAYEAGTRQISHAPRPSGQKVAAGTEQMSQPLVSTGKALPALRVLGQYRRNYILAEGPDGLYLIDQHAAHERIQFEKLMAEHAARQIAVQAMLEPELVETSPQQSTLFQKYQMELAVAGFALELFGPGNWLVRSVPAVLAERNWRQVLTDLLDSSPADGQHFTHKLLALAACHSAIRFGQLLEMDEMRALVRQLEEVDIPQSCPHGRPLMICLTDARLSQEFKRT
jgi:DNA mismatch repair protein MutL